MPLNYRRNGSTYQVDVYDADVAEWEGSLKIRTSSSTKYAPLTGEVNHEDATHIRVRNDSTTYAVLKEQDQGEAWGWGNNGNGVLDSGNTISRSSPVQVTTKTDWVKVNASYSCDVHLNYTTFNAAIRSDGTLWTWGGNYEGELGLGDRVTRSSPVQVGSLTDWRTVDCGSGTMCAVKTDGTLWTWGDNTFGNLGNGNTDDRSSPVQVGSLTDWERVVGSGNYSNLALKTDGTLWAWGNNSVGDLAQGTSGSLTIQSSPVQIGSDTDWKRIFSGTVNFAAIKTDGTLWVWGQGTYYQLGTGDNISRSSPVQVGSDTDWKTMDIGSRHMMAIKTDGTLWGWGENAQGRLGLGDEVDRSSPSQVGSDTDWKRIGASNNGSFAIRTDGTLWVWGWNGNRELGLGSNNTSYSSPVQNGSDTDWMNIYVRDYKMLKREA